MCYNMSKKLTELKAERDNKIGEYKKLEEQRQNVVQKQNEIGKELLTLGGKIEAYEEMKK